MIVVVLFVIAVVNSMRTKPASEAYFSILSKPVATPKFLASGNVYKSLKIMIGATSRNKM